MFLFDLRDCQPTAEVEFHGGGEYGYRILADLLLHGELNANLLVSYDFEIGLNVYLEELLKSSNILTVNVKCESDYIKIFENYKVKLIFSPLISKYLLNNIPLNVKWIGTYHGTREFHLSDYSYNPNFMFENNLGPKSLLYKRIFSQFSFINKIMSKKIFRLVHANYLSLFNRLDLIVTSSEYSKTAINFYYNMKFDNKIKVIYIPKKLSVSEAVGRLISEDYILMISANRPEKNIQIVLSVIDELYEKKLINLKTVVTGKYPEYLIDKLNNKEYFIFFDYVSSEELESYYRHTSLFIYPTIDEGFGMPPLEALKYQRKVLVSHITSLPEICGNSVYYLNPFDRESIACSIIYSLQSLNPNIDYYNQTSHRQETDILMLINLFVNEYYLLTLENK